MELSFDECFSRFAFRDDSQADRMAFRVRIGAHAEHRDLTLAQTHAIAAARATSLHALGCRRGERVALLMPPSEQLITTFLGCLYMGMVPSIIAWPTAKIDPGKYQRNVSAVMKSLSADWLVAPERGAENLRDSLATTRLIRAEAVTATCATPIPPAPLESGAAFIQFSGGTTGTQKSVPVSHDLLRRALLNYASSLDLRETDEFISWLPLYHDMGLIANLLMPFLLRIPVTVFSPMEWVTDPLPFMKAIGEHRASVSWMPNFAYAFLADRIDAPPGSLDLSSMRLFINGSEPTRVESMEAFIRAFEPHGLDPSSMHGVYGMAEAVLALSQTNAKNPPRRLTISSEAFGKGRIEETPSGERQLFSCGPPIRGIDMRVVDASDDECAAGTIGEIWIKGETVMDDYLDADKSDKGARWAFTPDGWYRTGDLGALIDGHVYVTGRKKDLIIAGGVNIYPDEVEFAVSRVARVKGGRVVAMGIEDPASGTERFVVIAEVDDEEDLADARAIENDVRQAALAVSGVSPDAVRIVPPRWMIKSTAGKVSRPETKTKLLELEARTSVTPPPDLGADAGKIETYLRAAIAALLGTTVEHLGDAPLEALGLGSLATTRLIAQIRRDIRVILAGDVFVRARTIRDVADEIADELQRLRASPVSRPPLLASGYVRAPLSYTQADFWEWEQHNPGTSSWNIIQACSIDGLDRAALKAAANQVVQRHDALRTAFVVEEGQVVQVVAPATRVEIPTTVLDPRAGESMEACIRRAAEEEVAVAFDLERGPLHRWRLLELDPTHHVLLVTVHHIVADAWAMSLLFSELGKLYAANRAGAPPPLPPLPFQFADFAVWQREAASSPGVLADVAYWRAQLAGGKQVSLGAAIGEPPRNVLASTKLDTGGPVEAMMAVARAEKISPLTVALAAASIALRRAGAGDDFVVLAPFANRDEIAHAHAMIASLVDRMMIRVDLTGDPTYREVLARTERRLTEGRIHARVCSRLVLGSGAPSTTATTLGGRPPFNSLCAMNFVPPPVAVDVGGLRYPYFLPILPGYPRGNHLFSDVIFYLLPTPSGPEFVMAANVSDEGVAHVASLFTQSMTALLTDPDAPIGDALPRSATPD